MSLEDQYDAWVRSVTGTGRHSATKQDRDAAQNSLNAMQAQLDALAESQKRQKSAADALNAVQRASAATADSVRRMSSELTQSLRQDGLLGGKTAQPAPAAEPVKAGPENFNGLADRVRQQVLGQDAFVGQVGKAFRNEITPGNFTFRTREFEQMECEFFCKPGTDLEWFAYWKDYCVNWLKSLGIREENLRLRDHEPAELAFYSRATTDIEYAFPFTDWGELWGIADRTDYDLKRHQEASGKDLTYFDQEANEHYIPYVIEPSLGCDRVALAFLCEAYDEEVIDEAKNDVRVVLHLHPALAPYKAAILPLSKKLAEPARKIYQDLCGDFMLDYDDTGSIGKRYRREDEIGTPYCITVDFATVGDDKTPADNAVTIRERDSMEQVRVPISELKNWLAEHTKF